MWLSHIKQGQFHLDCVCTTQTSWCLLWGSRVPPNELSKSIKGVDTRGAKKKFLLQKRVFAKKHLIFQPKMSFLIIKRRLRQAASRGKLCFSQRNAILSPKSACGKPPAEENDKKHKNLHKTVIRRTFRARSQLKIFSFQNPVRIRSSYCAKTFNWILLDFVGFKNI